jgi:hypothetical protein
LRYHSDPAVLYLARRDYPRAAPLLGELHRDMSPWLRSTLSSLVKRMAGVGLAEDPGDGSSFGSTAAGCWPGSWPTRSGAGSTPTSGAPISSCPAGGPALRPRPDVPESRLGGRLRPTRRTTMS